MTNTQNNTAVWTFDGDIVSDLHKDAYGFRPSQTWWEIWDSCLDSEKQKIWDDLLESLKASIIRDEEDRAWAVKKFEEMVSATMEVGAKTREDALRWLMDASDCGGDWEYYCFQNGLPYGYFKKVA